ncbi:uncharacterized protein LOC131877127 isoform X1 [Tigriopus californicus]|uniref:uncharacterized protein LOC131877127 isoform X1 n=1 Tax=Tigriopus californicus TaxID=6832 RepID=UPI0027DA8B8B|nr:uncharacterized protein LOC131877127 isoform X1 [Tigriopus californicus]
MRLWRRIMSGVPSSLTASLSSLSSSLARTFSAVHSSLSSVGVDEDQRTETGQESGDTMSLRCSLCRKNQLPTPNGRPSCSFNYQLVAISPVILVHKMCLESAHGLPRRSICDYSEDEVTREIQRCLSLSCCYCQASGAFVQCAQMDCQDSFHLSCFYDQARPQNKGSPSSCSKAMCRSHFAIATTEASPVKPKRPIRKASRPSKSPTKSLRPMMSPIKDMRAVFCRAVDSHLSEKSSPKRTARSPLGPKQKLTAPDLPRSSKSTSSSNLSLSCCSSKPPSGKENRTTRVGTKSRMKESWIIEGKPAPEKHKKKLTLKKPALKSKKTITTGKGIKKQKQAKSDVPANKTKSSVKGRKVKRGTKGGVKKPNVRLAAQPYSTGSQVVLTNAPSSPAKKFVENKSPFIRPVAPSASDLKLKSNKKVKRNLSKHFNANSLPNGLNKIARGPLSNKEIQQARNQFRVKKLVKKINAEHKPISERQLFHISNNQPVRHEVGESEYEENYQWLVDNSNRQIDDFLDLNSGEKGFMKLWNTFLHHNPCYGDRMLVILLEKFIQETAPTILAKNLYRNFVLHVTNLHDFGSLDQDLLSHMINRMRLALYNCVSQGSPIYDIASTAEPLNVNTLTSSIPSSITDDQDVTVTDHTIEKPWTSDENTALVEPTPNPSESAGLNISGGNTSLSAHWSRNRRIRYAARFSSSNDPSVNNLRLSSCCPSTSPSVSSGSSMEGSVSYTSDSAIDSISDLSSLDSISPTSGRTRSASKLSILEAVVYCGSDRFQTRRRRALAQGDFNPSRKRKMSFEAIPDLQQPSTKRLRPSPGEVGIFATQHRSPGKAIL